MSNFDCNICVEEKKIKEKVTCPCGFEACKDCIKQYLLSKIQEAHCMSCKTGWGNKFLIDNFTKSWVEGNKEGCWRHYQKSIALDREKSRIPETLAELPKIKAREKAIKEADKLCDDLKAQRIILEQKITVLANGQKTKEFETTPYTKKIKDFPKGNGITEEKARMLLGYRKCKIPEGMYVRTTNAQKQVFKPGRAHQNWFSAGIYMGPEKHKEAIEWLAKKAGKPKRIPNNPEELRRAREELRQIKNLMFEAREQARNARGRDDPALNSPNFICPCPDDDCKGMIESKGFTCVKCEKKVCRRCREPKPVLTKEDKSHSRDLKKDKKKKHKCNKEVLENIKFLRQDTKPCPNCATAIHKIDGCFAPNEQILTYDGQIVQADQIKVGMKLMGDDGTIRIVTQLMSGEDDMYEICQNKADNYTVSSFHKLVVKFTNDRAVTPTGKKWKCLWFDKRARSKTFETKDKAIEYRDSLGPAQPIEITIRDYLKLPKSTQKSLHGYRSNGYEGSLADHKIDPYILGFWLGDGYANGTSFALNESETLNKIVSWAGSIGCEVVHEAKYRFTLRRPGHGSKHVVGVNKDCCSLCETITPIILDKKVEKTNAWKDQLRLYNLLNNKHIPDEYMNSSIEVRKAILAGLIDSDGHVAKANKGKRVCIVQKVGNLGKQITMLARSLGFCVHSSIQERKNVVIFNSAPKDYCDQYKINISGRIGDLPTIIPRKKCCDSQPNKDYMVTSIQIKSIGKGRYYGWSVDGPNKRFVLPDFTVVRNCDQMYCTSCHTAFSWRTGKLETGTIHNPHAIAWQREHGQMERDINDIPCGGLVQMRMIRLNKELSEIIEPIHRVIAEIDLKIRQPRNDFSDLRLQYVRDIITEKQWRQGIFVRERDNARRKANADIYVTLRTLAIERFRDLAENVRNQQSRLVQYDIVDKFVKEMEEIRTFINKAFMDELPPLGTKKPIQILNTKKGWYWKDEYERANNYRKRRDRDLLEIV